MPRIFSSSGSSAHLDAAKMRLAVASRSSSGHCLHQIIISCSAQQKKARGVQSDREECSLVLQQHGPLGQEKAVVLQHRKHVEHVLLLDHVLNLRRRKKSCCTTHRSAAMDREVAGCYNTYAKEGAVDVAELEELGDVGARLVAAGLAAVA